MIIHGDCVEVMAGMDPESVDAIVTDPPYGLEFMGKEWDKLGAVALHDPSVVGGFQDGNGGNPFSRSRIRYGTDVRSAQAWHQQWAEAAYRVAKPSAYLLAFGGTRTVHRMTVALEDAGWIIRDMLVWGYASGFPKSKASLKPAWEPIVMARKPGPLRMLAIDECRIPVDPSDPVNGAVWTSRPSTVRPGTQGFVTSMEEGQRNAATAGELGRWPANIVLTDPIFDGGVDGVVGGGETTSGYLSPAHNRNVNAGNGLTHGVMAPIANESYGDSGTYSRFYSIPVTIGACWYCGVPIADGSSRDGGTPDTLSGTAPENASSPLSSSSNDPAPSAATRSVEAGGSTAHRPVPMWVDAVSESDQEPPSTSASARTSSPADIGTTPPIPRSKPLGTSPESTPPKASAKSRAAASPATDTTTTTPARSMCATCADLITSGSIVPADSSPNYPRFLIIPKAARSDREPVLGGGPSRVVSVWGGDEDDLTPGKKSTVPRQNVHPTVKPTELMRHLVRLVTPAGGVVLDPFLGSGTTALAAEMEGFAWIGIEREAEYVAIAEARLNGTQRGLGLGA